MASDHVFLSPHRDDAVLSCGGVLAALAAAERSPAIVNVFAGTDAPELERWTQPEIARLVAVEDELACAVVGASRIDLPFVAAPNRSPSYADWEAVVGEVPADDARLDAEIVEALRECGALDARPVVFAPLGIGGHVDHRIVHAAARKLLAGGARVLFYEDFPYCASEEAVHAFAFPPDFRQLVVSLGPFADEKFYAIGSYRSQVPGLFPEGVCTALARYARRAGANEFAESYWCPAEVATALRWADLPESLSGRIRAADPAGVEDREGSRTVGADPAGVGTI
ncbi:MAG TPA: PIG-L family deacetylase [Candidatus Acidoferrales bacterium]|nr:PIG-L family deacetylase [Candidatus Acidoferrales bacterium]